MRRSIETASRRDAKAIAAPILLIAISACAPVPGEPAPTPLGSTRLLMPTDGAAADSWSRWRATHGTVGIEGLEAHVGTTLELVPIPGTFFATAYATPTLAARRIADRDHRHPIHATPSESIPASALPTRREIPDFDLEVLAWVSNGLDAYLVEVNGAARLDLPGGESLHLAWGRTNERPYTSLGRLMIERGLASEAEIDLEVIRRVHDEDPRLVESLMLENDRAVFFDVIDSDSWPRASSGERLVADAAVAVDPEVIPLGSILRVRGPSIGTRFAVAVDTGGAIKGRRLDLYFGAGPEAIERAGDVRETVHVDLVRPFPRPIIR